MNCSALSIAFQQIWKPSLKFSSREGIHSAFAESYALKSCPWRWTRDRLGFGELTADLQRVAHGVVLTRVMRAS